MTSNVHDMAPQVELKALLIYHVVSSVLGENT